jgi:hypothetical protein
MKVFKKNPSPQWLSREEALRCKPLKDLDVVELRLESGTVMLTYPVRHKPWVSAIAKRLGWDDRKTWTKKLQLDELGTAVWDLLDGKRTVQKITQLFAKKYKLLPKEAELSVSRFLMELGKRGLIGLK